MFFPHFYVYTLGSNPQIENPMADTYFWHWHICQDCWLSFSSCGGDFNTFLLDPFRRNFITYKIKGGKLFFVGGVIRPLCWSRHYEKTIACNPSEDASAFVFPPKGNQGPQKFFAGQTEERCLNDVANSCLYLTGTFKHVSFKVTLFLATSMCVERAWNGLLCSFILPMIDPKATIANIPFPYVATFLTV